MVRIINTFYSHPGWVHNGTFTMQMESILLHYLSFHISVPGLGRRMWLWSLNLYKVDCVLETCKVDIASASSEIVVFMGSRKKGIDICSGFIAGCVPLGRFHFPLWWESKRFFGCQWKSNNGEIAQWGYLLTTVQYMESLWFTGTRSKGWLKYITYFWDMQTENVWRLSRDPAKIVPVRTRRYATAAPLALCSSVFGSVCPAPPADSGGTSGKEERPSASRQTWIPLWRNCSSVPPSYLCDLLSWDFYSVLFFCAVI